MKGPLNSKDPLYLQLLSWVENESKVLDLGCGDGSLLQFLKQEKGITALGVEIDHSSITECLDKGIDVIEADLNNNLSWFDTNSFDLVVMTQTIQVLKNPVKALQQMVRIGKKCVVTFPNFGYLGLRLYLGFKGKMPMAKHLPFHWYDTPNIHFFTIKDFETSLKDHGLKVIDKQFEKPKGLEWLPYNLSAKTATYLIAQSNL